MDAPVEKCFKQGPGARQKESASPLHRQVVYPARRTKKTGAGESLPAPVLTMKTEK
jgi:hypothetical protein